MEKIQCDIIRDLIPSYVDGICSEATRECVEEHMAGCEGCRRMAALCRERGLSGEKLEEKELDGLKRIKQVAQNKGLVCCGLAVFILGYMGISILGHGELYYFSFQALCVMGIICLCLLLLSGMGFKAKKAPGRLAIVLGIASAVIALATFMLLFCFTLQLQALAGQSLSDGHRIGTFFAWQMWLAHSALLILLLCHLGGILRRDESGNWLLCLDAAGCLIVSACHSMMRNMQTPEAFMRSLLIRTAVAAAIGALGMVISVLLRRASRQKMQ